VISDGSAVLGLGDEGSVSEDPEADRILPEVLDERVAPAVAEAVKAG
jgi:malic enzyme